MRVLVLLLVLKQAPVLYGGKLYVPPPTIFQAAEAGSHEVTPRPHRRSR